LVFPRNVRRSWAGFAQQSSPFGRVEGRRAAGLAGTAQDYKVTVLYRKLDNYLLEAKN